LGDLVDDTIYYHHTVLLRCLHKKTNAEDEDKPDKPYKISFFNPATKKNILNGQEILDDDVKDKNLQDVVTFFKDLDKESWEEWMSNGIYNFIKKNDLIKFDLSTREMIPNQEKYLQEVYGKKDPSDLQQVEDERINEEFIKKYKLDFEKMAKEISMAETKDEVRKKLAGYFADLIKDKICVYVSSTNKSYELEYLLSIPMTLRSIGEQYGMPKQEVKNEYDKRVSLTNELVASIFYPVFQKTTKEEKDELHSDLVSKLGATITQDLSKFKVLSDDGYLPDIEIKSKSHLFPGKIVLRRYLKDQLLPPYENQTEKRTVSDSKHFFKS
jgi:hypothetical protein